MPFSQYAKLPVSIYYAFASFTIDGLFEVYTNLNTGSHPSPVKGFGLKGLFLYIISIPLCTETLSLAYKHVFIFHEENSFLHILSQANASFFCSHDSRALPNRKYCVFSLPPFHYFHI